MLQNHLHFRQFYRRKNIVYFKSEHKKTTERVTIKI